MRVSAWNLADFAEKLPPRRGLSLRAKRGIFGDGTIQDRLRTSNFVPRIC
jgi:hypothetical protein